MRGLVECPLHRTRHVIVVQHVAEQGPVAIRSELGAAPGGELEIEE